MKNTLSDLNNHLFAALERLNDEELTDEQLKREIERSKSIAKVSETIVHNASVQLDALKFADNCSNTTIGKLQNIQALGLKDES